MQNLVVEKPVNCPFCNETVFLLIDLSAGDQSYIEDCQVCCQPMQISFEDIDGDGQNLDLQVNCAA